MALLAAQGALGADNQLSKVVVTATRTQAAIQDVPASVSVVTRQDIDNSAATTVDQLLQGVPGLYAARMDPSSPNRIAQTYSRGFSGNTRTLVLVDGLPMNVLYDGQVDWSQLVNTEVERVEVVRGASSGLYGSNAMGGVINIISRTPEPGRHTDVTASYGSMNTKNLGARHSYSEGANAVSLSAARMESDGYDMYRSDTTIPAAKRAQVGTIKDNISGKFIRELSASDMLELSVGYLKDQSTGFYVNPPSDYIPQTREQWLNSLRWTRNTENLSASVIAYGRFGKQWADSLNTAYTAIAEKGEFEDKTLGLNGQLTYALSQMQKLTVGAEYVKGDVHNHYTYPGSTRLRDINGDITRYGVFVQDELRLSPRWIVNVAGRYDKWDNGGNQSDTDTTKPATQYASHKDNFFSPKLATLFKLRDDLNLRASVGKAFNLPTMTDLYAVTLRGTTRYWGNQNLAPEKVTAYEIGVDYYFAPQAYVKASLYQNDATDFIYSVRRDASNFDKVNVGKVQTKGLELEASYQLSAQLSLSASHTVNDSTIKQYDKDTTLVDKQLTTVPKHQSSLKASFVLAEGWNGFAAINRVGDRFGNDQNTSVYAGYTTLDLGVSKAVAKDVTARLAIMNLTDKKYEGIGYMAPGRVSTLSLNARF